MHHDPGTVLEIHEILVQFGKRMRVQMTGIDEEQIDRVREDGRLKLQIVRLDKTPDVIQSGFSNFLLGFKTWLYIDTKHAAADTSRRLQQSQRRASITRSQFDDLLEFKLPNQEERVIKCWLMSLASWSRIT